MRNLQTVLDAYIECALWSTPGMEGDPFEHLDESGCEVNLVTYADMQADCSLFLSLMPDNPLDDQQVGHDFWLTRNGHGTGFWDRGLGKVGEQLTQLAKQFGEFELYVDDDGYIQAMQTRTTQLAKLVFVKDQSTEA